MVASLATFKVMILFIHINWDRSPQLDDGTGTTDVEAHSFLGRVTDPLSSESTSSSVSMTSPPSLDDIDMDAIARSTMKELSSVRYFYLRARARFEVWEFQGGTEGERRMVKLTNEDGWSILGEHGVDQSDIDQLSQC